MLNENNEVRWVPFKKLVEVIEGVLKKNFRYNKYLKDNEEHWTWAANSRCKYIGMRIDMRDGHAVLYDRDGKCISVAQLESQLEAKNTHPSQIVIPLEEWAERDLGKKLCKDLKGHIEEFVESTNDIEDLYRGILLTLREHLRET